jgi:L-ascorbate metabolism protein UlaG (beta-lactamase superfamily)
MRITYIGHATLLLEFGGVRILTDPNFDPALAGFLRRVAPPGIPLSELPALDAVVVTHAHADHLSFHSLDRLPSGVPVYAPPAVMQWLRRRGYRQAEPIAPGDSLHIGHVRLSAAAAKHLGSRYGVDRWRSAANMYLLEDERSTCFFAGDTGLSPDTHRLVEERIHQQGRELDLALLPIGHAPWWKPRFRSGHLNYEDALTLWERLQARWFVPYHWGTFHHVTSGPFDAIHRLRDKLVEHAARDRVRILDPGQSLDVHLPNGSSGET